MSNVDPTASEPEAKPLPPVNEPSLNPFSDDAETLIIAEAIEPFELGHFLGRLQPAPTFHVPPRFGISAILGITTALALLFGLLRYTGAHELMYLFFGLLAMIICLAQMRWGEFARQVSVIAGGAILPVFVLALAIFADRRAPLEIVFIGLIAAVPIGGFLGYLTGTCAGGVFLLMDLFEKYWAGRGEPPLSGQLDGLGKHG